MTAIITEPQSYASLSGLPRIDIPDNLNLALASGRSVASLLWEIISLWRGPGKLSPQEYFYYRLWDPSIPVAEKRRFVGKKAQHEMHMACNSQYWYGAAADKILFNTIMKGACLPVPDLIAIAAAGRSVPGIPNLVKSGSMAAMLRRPELYPLFIKEVAGKFSLSVISADAYDVRHDEVVLLDGTRQSPDALATTLTSPNGYLVQRRLRQAPALADLFGPRLWSVRLLVFHGATGPVIHRAVAKIATGTNAADNFWRPGNMLGAIEVETGTIWRVVSGTGAGLSINPSHPDTRQPILGIEIPGLPFNARRLIEMLECNPRCCLRPDAGAGRLARNRTKIIGRPNRPMYRFFLHRDDCQCPENFLSPASRPPARLRSEVTTAPLRGYQSAKGRTLIIGIILAERLPEVLQRLRQRPSGIPIWLSWCAAADEV